MLNERYGASDTATSMQPAVDSQLLLAVSCKGLRKVYRSSREAVSGIDLDVRLGEVVGLLGPNGAGKTTTMGMIMGVVPPTDGTAVVLGWDVTQHPKEVKSRVGVVPQANWFDTDLSAYENLFVFGRYHGMPRREARRRAREALSFADLEDRADDKVEQLSGGMLRRLSIARALINDPALLILDEPTTGLDPQSRQTLWDYLFELRDAGKAILVSTHYMEEATAICNRVAIIDHGRLLRTGPPDDIVHEFPDHHVLTIIGSAEGQAGSSLVLEREGYLVERPSGRVLAFVPDAEHARSLLDTAGVFEGGECAVSEREMTLEDVFLRLTGRGLRDR